MGGWCLTEHGDHFGGIYVDSEFVVFAGGLGEEVSSHCDPSDSHVVLFLEESGCHEADAGFAASGGAFDHDGAYADVVELFVALLDDAFLVVSGFDVGFFDDFFEHWFPLSCLGVVALSMLF